MQFLVFFLATLYIGNALLGHNNILLYDTTKSFQYNSMHTQFERIKHSIDRAPKDQWINFLGYKIASPIGIPACAIMTSRGIAMAARLGFDVLTYKTIRCKAFNGYNLPNIVYVDSSVINYADIGTPFFSQQNCPQEPSSIAIANSFGNVSYDADFLRTDIAQAKQALLEGQVLIVSIYGDTLEEFLEAALIAYQAGADIIEANFSCPNLSNKFIPLYKNPMLVYEIAKEIVQKAFPLPVIIKVGYFDSITLLEEILNAAHKAGVKGICGINSVPMTICDSEGNPTFGSKRKIAGVSGAPIRMLAMDFIKNASQIIKTRNIPMVLLATGGVTKPEHFKEFLNAGATIAMSATGMMWNPFLAVEFHTLY